MTNVAVAVIVSDKGVNTMILRSANGSALAYECLSCAKRTMMRHGQSSQQAMDRCSCGKKRIDGGGNR